MSLAFFIYNPAKAIVSTKADVSFAEFVDFIKGLDGPVCAPSLGQLQKDYVLFPAATWVDLRGASHFPIDT